MMDVTQAGRHASATEPSTFKERVRKFMRPTPKLQDPLSPGLLEHEREHAKATQNRIADAITAFSGSMLFVYVHVIWFACWIGFGVEKYPYGLLTMIVSLEAIFLSTFVLISQNRADAKRQVIANEQWALVKKENEQNIELLKISNQILALTEEVQKMGAAFRDQDELTGLRKEIRTLRASLEKPSD
jgi:uncharacterized membrane protein